MRRISIVLLTLICFTTIASAQNPVAVTSRGGAALVGSLASVGDVVARMMSFDSDRDGKVTVSELPERMQALVARGDTSGDGTLDNSEIATLARTPSAQDARARINPGGYTFGDQVGLSSRAHVEGAIEDLRLPSATKEKALETARWFMDGLETDATADLLSELKPLLTTEQLAAFKAAIAKGITAGGAIRSAVIQQMGPEIHVARLSIPPAERLKAMTAVERFRSRLRPGNEERAALMETMKGILSGEERDNLRAALERRPLVKSGVPAVFSGVVRVEAVVEPRR
jgi:hypothetical protein